MSGAQTSRGGLFATIRSPAVSLWGNWILALWELYLRDPRCDRFALFQDDLVCCRNLRAYLDHCPYPERGYLNLYTSSSNTQIAPPGYRGWYLSNQFGRGAVALVFDRLAVQTLLSRPGVVDHALDPVRGKKAIDHAVIEAFRSAGWREYVHMPGLVQHTGHESTTGRKPVRESPCFVGEDHDALELLATTATATAHPLPASGK